MRITLTKFQEWELKELIPTYGETIEEVIKYILLSWLSKEGHSAINHNNHVKELMIKNHRSKK